jgi:hypothetical protein
LIVVDSSVWIANLRGQRIAQVRLLHQHSERSLLIVGDLVMGEVLQGARNEPHAERIEQDLRRNVVVPMVSDKLAVKAAYNYRVMRATGMTIRKTIDVLIATFCIEYGHDLLHNDRDYDAMETLLGLSVVR